ncbi:MAG: cytochrome C oxidase subunit I, partial [Deltaproteobacteria bacterium]
KVTGKMMNERLGKIHWFFSFIFMNGIFFPMFIEGLAGVSRRLYDGGTQYAHAQGILHWNEVMSISAWCLALAQIPFFINFVWSLWKGRRAEANPWRATTLEWAAATSPPLGHGNFETPPVVYRGPFEYSVPGAKEDFIPQNAAEAETAGA